MQCRETANRLTDPAGWSGTGPSDYRRRLTLAGQPAYDDWESVYRDNIVAIYQLLFRRVSNPPDAEDLAEEVMIRTLRPMRFPAPAQEVRAYLVRTARSVLAEHWRRHYAAAETLLAGEAIVEADLFEPHPNRAAAERALQLLSLLPERSRRILELRFLEGLSVREAAARMGVSEGNAKVLQFRALRRRPTWVGRPHWQSDQRGRLAGYFDELLRRRRPRRFAATDEEREAMAAAAGMAAVRPAADLPDPAFIEGLRARLASELEEESPTPRRRRAGTCYRRQAWD